MRKIGSYLLKILVGVYLLFVGGRLIYRMLEERPENMAWMCGIAALFLVTGSVYLVRLLIRMVRGRSAVRKREEEMLEAFETEAQKKRPLRDPTLFRTAPMPVLDERVQEEFPERSRKRQ